MKKVLTALLVILLLAFAGLDIYLGYQFFDEWNLNKRLEENIKEKTDLLMEADKDITELSTQLSKISEENKEAYTEYKNWVRHNEALEEILGREN